MLTYLEESEFTFTNDRLKKLLLKDQNEPLSLDSRGLPLRFIHRSKFLEEHDDLTTEWRQLHLPPVTQPFAAWLLATERAGTGALAHLELDRANETLIDWAFVKPSIGSASAADPSDTPVLVRDLERYEEAMVEWVDWGRLPVPSSAQESLDSDSVTADACHILCRLPATPPPFAEHEKYLASLDQDYFLPGLEKKWENMRAVRFVDSNTLRLAMHIAWGEESVSIDRMADAANDISRCFEVATKATDTTTTHHGRFLMRAFLWSAWHRMTMLHLHCRLGMQLKNPESVIFYPRMGVVGATMSSNLATTESAEGTPPYMCKWAYKLVSQDQAAMPPDLRALRERFAQAYGHEGPRCVAVSPGRFEQCKGESPVKCMRFKGAIIKDQSAHAESCRRDCSKLTWDEASYRNLPSDSGRAVSLTETDDTHIRYTSAGPENMAISHVWSHGQGGRPEMYGNASTPTLDYTGGYNRCLHHRFERVSRKLGCVSYWMDTPCIPRDHKLRRDEISHINDVFLGSKVTLVCDRDIMSMDVSNATLETMESILATVLVCDWNVRAWTFLEAMRATNIYLLGKDDTTVGLKEMLWRVWSTGDISLSNLFFTTPHLIPTPNYYRASSGWEGSKILETLSVDKAAAVLNNRHATRPGDDVVIWSLLCEEAPSYTAQELWTSLQARRLPVEVSTAFLVSDAPRLPPASGISGLSWAPQRPNLPGEQRYLRGDLGNFVTVSDENCEKGIITRKGLLAEWRIAQFQVDLSDVTNLPPTTMKYLESLGSKYLAGYRWGAVIRPAQSARYHLDLGRLGKGKGQRKDNEETEEQEVLVAVLA
ncbi:hypothetical protein OQA88_1497 [Cercophora sp. LCS_1]